MNKFWGLPKVSEKEKGLSGVRTWHWGRGAELRPFGCFLSLASFPGTHRIPSSLCLGLKNCKVDNLIKWCNKSTTCSKCKRAYYLLGRSQFQMETFKKKAAVCVHILYQMGSQSKVPDRAGASFGAGILIKQDDERTFSLPGESL